MVVVGIESLFCLLPVLLAEVNQQYKKQHTYKWIQDEKTNVESKNIVEFVGTGYETADEIVLEKKKKVKKWCNE